MELKNQAKNFKTPNYFNVNSDKANEVISINECKTFIDKFNLKEKNIALIRNYMIGIIDKTINSYLDNFK